MQAQTPPVFEPGDTTFTAIYNKWNDYYNNQSNGDAFELDEGGEENQFRRWAHFWRGRVDGNDGFSGINIAMSDLIRNGLDLCVSDEDNHIDWRNLGPFNSDGGLGSGGSTTCSGFIDGVQNQGRIESINIHPAKELEILAGGFKGGIWKTLDGGENWYNTTDQNGFSITGASVIVRHPLDPNIVYAAASNTRLGPWYFGHFYGLGIIKSTNGGETWRLTDQSPAYGFWGRVSAMEIDPNSTLNNTIIYLGTPNQIRKYVETPTNTTVAVVFTDSAPLPPYESNNFFTDIEIENDGRVWFCYRKGVRKIEPGSSISTAVTLPIPFNCTINFRKVTMDINQQGHLVVLVKYHADGSGCNDNNGNSILYRTTDSGANWEVQDFAGNPRYGAFVLAPNNSNVIYFERGNSGSSRCMAVSTDFGQTFTLTNNAQNHVDVRALVAYQNPPQLHSSPGYRIYLGTDGGVSKLSSTSPNNAWQDITGEGMANTMFQGLGITEQNGDFIFLGAQDGSINFYNDGNWFETIPGGDNGDCIINPNDYTQIFQQVQQNLVRTNLNATEDDVNYGGYPDPPGDDEAWLYPLYLNPNDPTEMFALTNQLSSHQYVWTTTGAWDSHSMAISDVLISSIAISENNDNLVYYAYFDYYHPWQVGDDVNAGGIYKYNKMTNTNTDISGDLKPELSAPISGIAVDPLDENRIWVTFSRFAPNYKVYKTENGGIHWEDVSGCLPNIPINAILYQKGTNDRLYIGTDFGVFYKDATMTEWVHYGNGGPKTLVVDMDINYCNNKLVVATQGRGLWQVDILGTTERLLSVDGGGTIIWDTDRRLVSDLRIAAGTTLEINNATIGISEDVKITIERGAKIIVDNSILTTKCGLFWKGIRVWGDASKSQDEIPLEQGKLIIRNNSTIEYARNAVKLGKDGDWQQNFTGGIVQVTDSKFRNNKRAVEFLKYRNFQPTNSTVTRDNRSFFTNVTFITDESLPYGENPSVFISMWDVDNIKIKACSFSNVNPDANTTDELGKGITATDASFYVGCGGTCPSSTPCCDADPSTFENLFYGVKALNVTASKTFKIDNSKFTNCVFGIQAEAVNYFTITRNTFQMGYTPAESLMTIGVYNTQGTQFRIEENFFFEDDMAFMQTVGTFMHHTGLDNNDNNEIYKNRFQGLTLANWSYGDNNTEVVNDNDTRNGLAYFCNLQSNSSHGDIMAQSGTGLRQYFYVIDDNGSGKTAGNTFTNDASAGLGAESSFYNHAFRNINYYYGTGVNEFPEYTTPVPKFTAASGAENSLEQNGCPSHLLIQKPKEALAEKYEEEKQKWENYSLEWRTNKDTDGENDLKGTILLSGKNDPTLKGELLAKSPYLSAATLLLLVENDKFSGQNLFDILKANPEAVVQSGILAYIEQHQLLDATMLSALQESIGQLSARGILEAKITAAAAARDFYNTSYIRALLFPADETENIDDFTVIKERLGNFNSPAGTLAMVDLEYNKGNKATAMQALAAMGNQFDFSDNAQLEFGYLKQLYTILTQADAQNRNEANLNQVDLDALQNIAENGQGLGQVKAKNILSFFYGIVYGLDLTIPGLAGNNALIQDQSNGEKASIAKSEKIKAIDKAEIIIAPNPVNTELRINYRSPSKYGNTGTIKIIDTAGKVHFEANINEQEQEFILDTSHWLMGMYYGIYTNQSGKHKIMPFTVYH